MEDMVHKYRLNQESIWHDFGLRILVLKEQETGVHSQFGVDEGERKNDVESYPA
jgi:hypothetical protein